MGLKSHRRNIGAAERLRAFAGFEFTGFRSFGSVDEKARVGLLGKTHLLVGKNNAGKSNISRFINDVLAKLPHFDVEAPFAQLFPHDLDRHVDWPTTEPIRFSVGLHAEEFLQGPWFADEKFLLGKQILAEVPFDRAGNGILWFDFKLANHLAVHDYLVSIGKPPEPDNVFDAVDPDNTPAFESDFDSLQKAVQNIDSTRLEKAVAAISSGVPRRASEVLGVLVRAFNPLGFVPDIGFVDAVRYVDASDEPVLASGRGLINQLFNLKSTSSHTMTTDREAFKRFEFFIRQVLEDPSIEIIIPIERDAIYVGNSELSYPLDRLGSGIADLVIIAANATIHNHTLLCIEEPELHLHPDLQRKLLHYLEHETTNRYLISTHSAAFLNAGVASVSHVVMRDGVSEIKPAISKAELARVVSDLGNRASDLIQSNFIIWVEGPSDRLYIRKWLELTAPDLIENAHFVIMFYGGALLTHLSASEEDAGELIELLKINRNFAIVIDSDRESEDAPLTATKQRVITEAQGHGAMVWVTDGYTIENYIPRANLNRAVGAAYPAVGDGYEVATGKDGGKWVGPLSAEFVGRSTKPGKVPVAREVVAQMSEVPVAVRGHVDCLVGRIREANGV